MNHFFEFEDRDETPFTIEVDPGPGGYLVGIAKFSQTCDGPLFFDAPLCLKISKVFAQAADVLTRGEIAVRELRIADLDRHILTLSEQRDALCREIDQAAARGIVSAHPATE